MQFESPVLEAEHVVWMQQFLNRFGSELPRDYLAFDCETTGFSRKFDLPVDIGWVIVRDCQLVHRGSYLLNWADHPGIEYGWLDERLTSIQEAMAEKHQDWPYSAQRLRDEGRPVGWVLDFFLKLLRANREAEAKLVGQNAWSFDVELLTATWQQTMKNGDYFDFQPDEIYDVGCIEKALLAGNLEPFPDDHTLKDYFLRVAHANRKGVFWNAAACAERYKLTERYDLDPRKLHTAEVDAYVSHLLLEEHRAVFDAACVA